MLRLVATAARRASSELAHGQSSFGHGLVVFDGVGSNAADQARGFGRRAYVAGKASSGSEPSRSRTAGRAPGY
jgi:hypothetical protein